MTLSGLLYALGQIGINDKLVNYAAAGSSIYALNDVTQRDYPCFFASPTGTHRVSENYVTYQVTLFVFDRLLEDNSNDIDVQSTSVETLKNLIKKIPYLEGVAGISDEYTIQVFVETEKFKDRTTGAYATIEIMLLNESTCIMPDEGEPTESGDTPTENWYLYFNNPDGETIPAESTAYTVEWRTNIPDIPYIIYGPEGVIESGSTDGEIRKEVDFAENESTATTREYTFMFLKDNGDNLSGLTWYQAAVEVQPEPEPGPEPGPDPEPPTPDTGETDYYFNFTVSDNQVIPADATGFTVSWRTNYPEVEYIYESPSGSQTGIIDSGTTSMTFTFPENHSTDETANFTFMVFTRNEGEIGSVSWKQAVEDAYFEFITQDGVVLSSAATSYHVEWDTNYSMLQYELTGDNNNFLETGYTHSSAHTFTFPASMIGRTTKFTLRIIEPYRFAELGTLTWKQEANSEIPHDYSADYLTLEILSGGTITNKNHKGNPLRYSIDDGETWHFTDYEGDNEILVEAGDKVLLKNPQPLWSGFDVPMLEGSTAVFNVYGNLFSLVEKKPYVYEPPYNWNRVGANLFHGVFANTKVVSAENLVFPDDTAKRLYSHLFAGCTMLTTAPKNLPAAATVEEDMFICMFDGCTSLTTAPNLPATTVAERGYSSMFRGCTSLVNAPVISATTLGANACSSMFSGCTSLTTAPELPATTLDRYCYSNMFYGCTSLVNGPSTLPATTLAERCYERMFQNCTSLTTAPELPASAQSTYSYAFMFWNCSSLNYIKCLATTNIGGDNDSPWVHNVSSTGTFVKAAEAIWSRGPWGIPNGWTVQEI